MYTYIYIYTHISKCHSDLPQPLLEEINAKTSKQENKEDEESLWQTKRRDATLQAAPLNHELYNARRLNKQLQSFWHLFFLLNAMGGLRDLRIQITTAPPNFFSSLKFGWLRCVCLACAASWFGIYFFQQWFPRKLSWRLRNYLGAFFANLSLTHKDLGAQPRSSRFPDYNMPAACFYNHHITNARCVLQKSTTFSHARLAFAVVFIICVSAHTTMRTSSQSQAVPLWQEFMVNGAFPNTFAAQQTENIKIH